MNAREIAQSRIGRVFVQLVGRLMENPLRYRLFGPTNILKGVDNLPSGSVLEIGCGTGYFTIPAARLIGEDGCLVAMDIVPDSVELVSKKVQVAGVENVRVLLGDALKTSFDDRSFDTVLLFGVIPSPMLPLKLLLAEMHRVLKPDGIMAAWPPIPGYLPGSILTSGKFRFVNKRNGVFNFRRC